MQNMIVVVNLEERRVVDDTFANVDAALDELRLRYSEIPDPNTAEGYASIKEGVKTVTGYRTSLEKKRKELKAPYIESGKILDAEAKRITAALVAIEEPLKAAKAVRDEAEKRKKEDRITRLQAKIDEMTGIVDTVRGKSSEVIQQAIAAIGAYDTANDFYDLTEEATLAQRKTTDTLATMLDERLQFEELERKRFEAEELAAKARLSQAIAERINQISMIPSTMMGASSKEFFNLKDHLRDHPPAPVDFPIRYDDAVSAHKTTLAMLQQMGELAVSREKALFEEPAPNPKIGIEEENNDWVKEASPADIEESAPVEIKLVCSEGDAHQILSHLLDNYKVSIDGELETGLTAKIG